MIKVYHLDWVDGRWQDIDEYKKQFYAFEGKFLGYFDMPVVYCPYIPSLVKKTIEDVNKEVF